MTAIRLTLVLALALALGACAYDYAQRTDRVAYGAGNAVKANLEAQTINPANPASQKTSGLGKNGDVMPATTE